MSNLDACCLLQFLSWSFLIPIPAGMGFREVLVRLLVPRTQRVNGHTGLCRPEQDGLETPMALKCADAEAHREMVRYITSSRPHLPGVRLTRTSIATLDLREFFRKKRPFPVGPRWISDLACWFPAGSAPDPLEYRGTISLGLSHRTFQ